MHGKSVVDTHPSVVVRLLLALVRHHPALLVVDEPVVDDLRQLLRHLGPGDKVASAVKTLVLPRPARRLGDDDELADLAVRELVQVGVAVEAGGAGREAVVAHRGDVQVLVEVELELLLAVSGGSSARGGGGPGVVKGLGVCSGEICLRCRRR